jgi:tRNA(Ile)-lysidine synthase TilS/MesJ
MSVMDSIADPDITFDENGVCNYYHLYLEKAKSRLFDSESDKNKLTEIVDAIKAKGKNHEYDCIIGVSGGVDSTYVAYLVKQLGLRPLAVHFDNGWNSELAVKNIEQVLNKLSIDLFTYVIDWEV